MMRATSRLRLKYPAPTFKVRVKIVSAPGNAWYAGLIGDVYDGVLVDSWTVQVDIVNRGKVELASTDCELLTPMDGINSDNFAKPKELSLDGISLDKLIEAREHLDKCIRILQRK